MARKFDLISELYERTCFAVTDNPVNWQSFLKTAGRNFRLRFDEQLLIYAQRPDATAVLEIERWNGTFGRWVNRGAKGIAVFEDADRSRQRLIHYFDISDTHESRHSRPVPIWEMRPDYEAEVIETLENTFGAVNDTTSIENVVKESIANAVEDNIADYISDFMSLGAGSDIEYLSADEANALYLELIRNSVSYMVMKDTSMVKKTILSNAKTVRSHSRLDGLYFFTVFKKIVLVFLFAKLIALCNQRIHFQSNKVYVGTHCPCNLLNVIAVFNVFQNSVVRKRSLRSKDVCFILHTVLPHFKDIELFEPADSNSFLPVENIVSDFVP